MPNVNKTREQLFVDRFRDELPYLIRDKVHIFRDIEIPKVGQICLSYTPYTIVKCTGVFSLCKDNKHIVFLDYDNVYESRVLQDIDYLQKKYRLGNAYILTTKRGLKNSKDFFGNYLVFFLDKFTFRRVVEIQAETHADDLYKKIEDYPDKGFVIRTSQKGAKPAPELIKIVKAESGNPKSNAHRLFFEHQFDITIYKDETFDNETKYQIVQYSTFA